MHLIAFAYLFSSPVRKILHLNRIKVPLSSSYYILRGSRRIPRVVNCRYTDLCGMGWWNAPVVDDADGLDVAAGMRLGFQMPRIPSGGGGGGTVAEAAAAAAAADSGNCRDSPTE